MALRAKGRPVTRGGDAFGTCDDGGGSSGDSRGVGTARYNGVPSHYVGRGGAGDGACSVGVDGAGDAGGVGGHSVFMETKQQNMGAVETRWEVEWRDVCSAVLLTGSPVYVVKDPRGDGALWRTLYHEVRRARVQPE